MPDQFVQIVEYDLAWPDRFADQWDRVTAVLGPWLASPVEHIGSTSVPGLPAKPVIDMLAPVCSLQARTTLWELSKRTAGCPGQKIHAAITACGSCGPGQRPEPIIYM
jgi:GrpB-like predicted nucleotidyltransferase (UPF0157 family)